MHNNFSKYLWSCKIDISDFTNGDEHFITLREPSVKEFKEIVKLQKKADKSNNSEDYEEGIMDMTDEFCDLCCVLMIDHNFYSEEENGTVKLGAKDVTEFIRSKLDLAQNVIYNYMKELPLLQTSRQK